MFIGPWDGGGPWNSRGIDGMYRFLVRVWNLVHETGGGRRRDGASAPRPPARQRGESSNSDHRELPHWTHKTIKKVTDDLRGFHFNTALAALMEFVNYLYGVKDEKVTTPQWREALRALVLLLAPMTPHIAEELWEQMGESYSVHTQRWPTLDEALARAETTVLVLQVDGKVRDRIQIPMDLAAPQARELALRNEKVRKFIEGRQVADVVVVPGRLVNIVTK
jgi:leucyl-tRNA synthetase